MMPNNDFNSKYGVAFRSWIQTKRCEFFEFLDESSGDIQAFRIRPINRNACQIFISCRNASTQISCGKRIWFDETDGLYAEDNTLLTTQLTISEFTSLLESIWQGNVWEKIQFKNNSEISNEGWIKFNGKKYGFRKRNLFNLLTKPDLTQELCYKSYEEY